MRNRSALLIAAPVAIVASLVFNGASTGAAVTRLPTTLYPAGASISYRTLSNHQMDCLWGFFCEGNVPLFHFYTQDQLHRVGGWAQFAGLRRHGRVVMSFELFSSRYRAGGDLDGTPFSKEAFEDLTNAIHAHGYVRLGQQPHLLPASVTGGSVAEIERLGPTELVVMASWSGTQEVESILLVDHGSASIRAAAYRYLTEQTVSASREL
jgi:hypothetical protein